MTAWSELKLCRRAPCPQLRHPSAHHTLFQPAHLHVDFPPNRCTVNPLYLWVLILWIQPTTDQNTVFSILFGNLQMWRANYMHCSLPFPPAPLYGILYKELEHRTFWYLRGAWKQSLCIPKGCNYVMGGSKDVDFLFWLCKGLVPLTPDIVQGSAVLLLNVFLTTKDVYCIASF